MLKEFKTFVLRGNVVDLAVGVVIGAAFGAIVTGLVGNIVTPLLAHLHLPDFSRAFVDFNHNGKVDPGDIRYGLVINAVISFITIAFVIFFFVVKPLNRLTGREKEAEPKNRECPYCRSSVPVLATVCAFCTREIEAASGP
jgi:large conductance mechanosensitive channel